MRFSGLSIALITPSVMADTVSLTAPGAIGIEPTWKVLVGEVDSLSSRWSLHRLEPAGSEKHGGGEVDSFSSRLSLHGLEPIGSEGL